jgi:hypothetical protein
MYALPQRKSSRWRNATESSERYQRHCDNLSIHLIQVNCFLVQNNCARMELYHLHLSTDSMPNKDERHEGCSISQPHPNSQVHRMRLAPCTSHGLMWIQVCMLLLPQLRHITKEIPPTYVQGALQGNRHVHTWMQSAKGKKIKKREVPWTRPKFPDPCIHPAHNTACTYPSPIVTRLPS